MLTLFETFYGVKIKMELVQSTTTEGTFEKSKQIILTFSQIGFANIPLMPSL